MKTSEREKGLQAARSMERRGQIEAACQAYLRFGAVEDAARLLGSLRRFSDAAETLMEHLGVTPDTATGLEGDDKRLALKAAIYLGRAGKNDEAVALLLSLGENARAAEILERSGDSVGAAKALAGEKRSGSGSWHMPDGVATTGQKLEAAGQREAALQAYVREGRPADAARVAQRLGRVEDAAQLYADAAMPFQAGRCYLQAGNRRNALQHLVRVGRNDKNYVSAAREAIRLADGLNVLEIHLEHFLTDYIRRGPLEELDLEAFYTLGKLYERWSFVENAEEAYRKVLERDPEYRDTQKLIQGLESHREKQRARLEKSLEKDAAFWGPGRKGGGGDDLPELPDLPDLPPVPGRGVAPPPPAAQAAAPAAAAPAKGGTRVLPSPGGGPPVSGAPPASAPAADRPEAGDENIRFVPGETVAGRYLLEQQIGEGGMATVFRAMDLELEEPIAMKVFRSSLTDDDSLKRFRQEIKLSRQLQQPNVTRVYDLGIAGGRRYLTMELLVGESLEDRLQRRVTISEGLEILIQACAGLQAAHERGIIHRDIKPDNLFITSTGVVKVMDFGIAKQQATPGFTVMGTIAGTPEYMSPEQVNNFTHVTSATDLYALGVVAFRIFTGKLPFEHEELVPLLVMQVQDPPPAPRSFNADIPAALERAILKLLEKDPSERFPTCDALADVLKAVREQL